MRGGGCRGVVGTCLCDWSPETRLRSEVRRGEHVVMAASTSPAETAGLSSAAALHAPVMSSLGVSQHIWKTLAAPLARSCSRKTGSPGGHAKDSCAGPRLWGFDGNEPEQSRAGHRCERGAGEGLARGTLCPH